MNLNYWDLYYYNIWHLINNYKLKYQWFSIEELKKIKYDKSDTNWNIENHWIKKYKKNKKGLAKDILENGTFFPFFVRANDDSIILCGGNHRVESLIKLSRIMLIEKNFLVIFFPIEIDKTIKSLNNNTILFFPNDFEEKIDKNYDSIPNIELISKMRKFGSYIVWRSKANLIYPQIFNDEQCFEKWIKTPLPYTRFDIYRAFKDKME